MQKFTVSLQEFIISYDEIIINGIPKFVPLKVKYINALGTAYLNRYLSIRNIYHRHDNTLINISDTNGSIDIMSYFDGYNRPYTIPVLSNRNTKYNPYNRLSRFK